MGVGNSFGRLFRISTWGESHGGGVGVTLDGCPPRVHLSRETIQEELDPQGDEAPRPRSAQKCAKGGRRKGTETREVLFMWTPCGIRGDHAAL